MGQTWWERQRAVLLALAIGLPIAWCAIAARLTDHLTSATAALVLVLLVVAAAATSDRLAGLVTAASGGVWFDFFLVPPFHRFTISDSDDIVFTVLLVLVGGAVTELALWGARQQAAASSRAGYLDGVITTSQIVAGDYSADELADQVAARITELLEVDGCRFVPGGAVPPAGAVLGSDGLVRSRDRVVDVDRAGLPILEEIIVPAQHHGVTHGWFVIVAASEIARPSVEQRKVAVLLANQVGAARAPEAPGLR